MFTLKTSVYFDSAHFLADYPGKCARLHGHRWQIEAQFRGEELCDNGGERGMLIDFHTLKSAMKVLAEQYDHTFLYEAGTLPCSLEDEMRDIGFMLTPLPFRPTAENFAKYFYGLLRDQHLPIGSVTVYETPNNAATYKE